MFIVKDVYILESYLKGLYIHVSDVLHSAKLDVHINSDDEFNYIDEHDIITYTDMLLLINDVGNKGWYGSGYVITISFNCVTFKLCKTCAIHFF